MTERTVTPDEPERLEGDWHRLFPEHYEAAVAEAAGALAGYHMGRGEPSPQWTEVFTRAFRGAIEVAFAWGFTAGGEVSRSLVLGDEAQS